MEQRSAEWYAARLGKLTASRIADALARTKSGWGASRANVRAEIVCERLTSTPTEGYTNAAMQWGIDTEPHARAAYEFFCDRTVELVGFVDHPSIAMSGCSPDGLVSTDGLVEIKCPNTATHIDTILSDSIAEKYRKQMLWQMACTGRTWCDFVSFDPRVPTEMQLYVQRFNADEKALKDLENEAVSFLIEVAQMEDQLREKFALKEAA
jgi:putative phage-type endonuclease